MALRRPPEPMPAEVADALDRRGLRAAYESRPPYQRNDDLGWINRAKRPETRTRRVQRMLDELAAGAGYMNMPWKPRG